MRDPIDALTELNPGDPVEQPPASEIRRRGDSRRRRRTATLAIGAAVAVAAVVVPVSLLSQRDLPIDPATGDSSTDQQTEEPADTPTDGPTSAVVTDIPDGFPIATGLDNEDTIELFGPAARGETGTDIEPVQPCGAEIWPAGGVDTLDVLATAPEWAESRQLATYTSAAEAVEVVTYARAALASCAETGTGDTQTLEVLEGDTGYDDVTFGLYESAGMPGGTVAQLMRVGSAVVLVSTSGEFTADSIAAGADELTAVSQQLAESMCTFTEAGCDGGSEGPDGSGEGASIPADFPIDRHLPTGSEFQQIDPNEGDDGIEICGQWIWPAGETETLSAMVVGPEQSETRWLGVFDDADRAAEVLADARSVLEDCSTTGADDSLAVIPLEGDTGYDDVTFAVVQANGQPGGELVQLMRVGSAILVSSSGGEFTAESAQGGADGITEQSIDLAAEMCVFTEAGC